MAVVGDWTKAVYQALSKPTSRPGWLYGPFPSPFSTAAGYNNLICVASGIGMKGCAMSEAGPPSMLWWCTP